MSTVKSIKNLDVAKVAAAIEADAGKKLPGLRSSLKEAKAGTFAAIHTPEQIAARKRGRPLGSTKEDAKIAIKIRLDPEVAEALRATGTGWQTRINAMLHASLHLAGKL